MADRTLISIMVGDQLVLPDDNGVMTGYTVERIEGDIGSAKLYLQNANVSAEPVRVIEYHKVD